MYFLSIKIVQKYESPIKLIIVPILQWTNRPRSGTSVAIADTANTFCDAFKTRQTEIDKMQIRATHSKQNYDNLLFINIGSTTKKKEKWMKN